MECHKASVMRELVCEIGGFVRPDEGRKGWLRRVARIAGISHRSVRAAFYREPIGEVFAAGIEAKLRAVISRKEAAARDELSELKEQLAFIQRRLLALDPNFYGPDVHGIGQILHDAGGKDPPA